MQCKVSLSIVPHFASKHKCFLFMAQKLDTHTHFRYHMEW